jgi:hypothetical protein
MSQTLSDQLQAIEAIERDLTARLDRAMFPPLRNSLQRSLERLAAARSMLAHAAVLESEHPGANMRPPE